MVWRNDTMMNPAIEELLERVDSKFTLVTLASRRARQVNAYFNQLGEGLGAIVPPQIASTARKPLSIAFEEIAADKITYERIQPGTGDEDNVEEAVERTLGPVGTLSDTAGEAGDGAGGEVPDA
ncbi:MAG TPA: DNA-directed RNA polymerase subunit omega [Acidimicrobiales bacterium]|jgi:DNA-directed RNA polymerase subunit omega|nr:DNA-directed RNA polymerase subunit omega [Acidimicrobiales bacterium]